MQLKLIFKELDVQLPYLLKNTRFFYKKREFSSVCLTSMVCQHDVYALVGVLVPSYSSNLSKIQTFKPWVFLNNVGYKFIIALGEE